ncbi:MAG: hypothetical protein GXO60_07240 [Epsilonproteobacteria bacterium]|nr:hypothetical protein [Campylobacterota bacterium]
MNILIQIIILMIALEIIEANFQKAATIGGMIDRLYGYYHKSVFLLFLAHPTLYFILFVSISTNIINIYIIIIILIKIFDIFFKIEIIQQKYIKKSIDRELIPILEMPITPLMRYLGIFIYVPLLVLGLFHQ